MIPSTQAQVAPPSPFSQRALSAEFWANYGFPMVFVLIAAVFAVSNPRFLTLDNFLLIMLQASITAIAAIGAAMVFISGRIDISQGAIMALSAAVCASLYSTLGLPEAVAILLGILCGVGVGILGGLLIEVARIPAFIVTLAVLFIVRGAVLMALGGQSVLLPPDEAPILRMLGNGRIGGVIPVVVVIAIVLFLIFEFVLRRTTWGVHLYAVGSSAESAARAGIRTLRLRVTTYAIAGGLSACAGLVLLGRLGAAPSELGMGQEFFIITAVVLGGVSVYGGKGKLWRGFMGAVFIAMLANGLVMMNVSAYFQQIVIGAALIIALLLDRIGAEENSH
jgi:ribose transport system permease protein